MNILPVSSTAIFVLYAASSMRLDIDKIKGGGNSINSVTYSGDENPELEVGGEL